MIIRQTLILSAIAAAGLLANGCSAEAARISTAQPLAAEAAASAQPGKRYASGATIEIAPNSPADTVRAFYQNLREGKIRAAIYLTNLRPAIEGLTDAELKEFQVDFETLARQVPESLEINGEITTGDRASVTVRLPLPDDPSKTDVQEIQLRRDGDVWVILTVDEQAEKKIRQEGRNYFFALKIATHQDEARAMLDRIAKAQMVYATQNGGSFGEMQQLIDAGLLPEDVKSSDSTGYGYSIKLSADKKNYSATAAPAVYGKTGKLTFEVQLKGSTPYLTSRDTGGK